MKGLKLLALGFSLLLTVSAITVSIYVYNDLRDATLRESEQVSKIASEWTESDVNMLLENDLTGTEVLNAIRKYKSDITVRVRTVKGSDKTYDNNTPVINDASRDSYINPSGVFTGEKELTPNGAIACLIFTEQGSVDAETINTAEEAKSLLAQEFPAIFENSDTWGTIVAKLKGDYSPEAKQNLAVALGGGHNGGESWADLSTAASIRISELTSDLANMEAAGQDEKVSGTLYPANNIDGNGGENQGQNVPNVQLPFTPDVIILKKQDSNEIAVYYGNMWYEKGVAVNNFSWCEYSNGAEMVTLTNKTEETLTYTIYRR